MGLLAEGKTAVVVHSEVASMDVYHIWFNLEKPGVRGPGIRRERLQGPILVT